jgi:hypothetical protein
VREWKLQFQLEALDRDVKKPHEQPSIGVLLRASKNHEFVVYGVWQRFETKWAIVALKPVNTAYRKSRLLSRRDVPEVIWS